MRVLVLLKNADFTEGRGPMCFHKAFVTDAKLEEYMNSLSNGVYGYRPPAGKTMYDMLLAKSSEHGGWLAARIQS